MLDEPAVQTSWKNGSCHCEAISWEALTKDDVVVQICNCSMCSRTGYQHLIIPSKNFRLKSGADQTGTYKFNTGVAQHMFCKNCGVKSYYVPRSHPDGISLNFRCMTRDEFSSVAFQDFDGRNWEESVGALAPISGA